MYFFRRRRRHDGRDDEGREGCLAAGDLEHLKPLPLTSMAAGLGEGNDHRPGPVLN